jgi:hypothetical protein
MNITIDEAMRRQAAELAVKPSGTLSLQGVELARGRR